MRSVLHEMTELTWELEDVFAHRFQNSVDAISGVTTRLTLSCHECIIVTVRPLVLSLLWERLRCFENGDILPPLSSPVRTLIQACVDSAARSLRLLTALRNQNLLGRFSISPNFHSLIPYRNIPPVRPRKPLFRRVRPIPNFSHSTRRPPRPQLPRHELRPPRRHDIARKPRRPIPQIRNRTPRRTRRTAHSTLNASLPSKRRGPTCNSPKRGADTRPANAGRIRSPVGKSIDAVCTSRAGDG